MDTYRMRINSNAHAKYIFQYLELEYFTSLV